MTYADVFTTDGSFINRVSVAKSHQIFRELNTCLNNLYQSKNVRRVVVIMNMNGRNSEMVATYTLKGWTINNV